MSSIIHVPTVKKADSRDIIKAMSKMSEILTERFLCSPDIDQEQVYQSILADESYESADNIDGVFIISDSLIGIPSILPDKNNSGVRRNGRSVTSLVHIPGSEPVYSHNTSAVTYVDNRIINLRGARSLSVHRVVPGMLVSFHHWDNSSSGRERTRIDVQKIVYNENGEIDCLSMPEEYGLVAMPRMEG